MCASGALGEDNIKLNTGASQLDSAERRRKKSRGFCPFALIRALSASQRTTILRKEIYGKKRK